MRDAAVTMAFIASNRLWMLVVIEANAGTSEASFYASKHTT